MKKQLLKSALIALAGVGLMSGSAMADIFNSRPVSENLSGLQANFDAMTSAGDIDASKQSTSAIWTFTDGGSTGYKITNYTNSLWTFGIYSFTTGTEANLSFNSIGAADIYFGNYDLQGDATDLYVATTNTTYNDFGDSFGFYIKNGSTTYYTEDSKNGSAYALAYLLNAGTKIGSFIATSDDWVLAFETGDGTATKTYTGSAYIVEDITAVPEPAAMLLFGTGVIGLAGVARRRN